MKALICLLVLGGWTSAGFAGAREELFRIEDFATLPPNVEILSERDEGNVRVTELKFDGSPFNGHPTRIYAFYARPLAGERLPGVALIHGAGLGRLKEAPAIEYAQAGFACLMLDWAGPAAERKKPRTPPYSEFVTPGSMARKGENGKFSIYGVEQDTITNGVRFVLRGLEFLRNQPEVDPDKLFVSGTSAGAHLTLLVVGLDSGIRGASVKYGSAFIRDFPGYFGGYFGPLSLSPENEQDEWLAVLDPKHGISDVKANVLVMSGTDDIFFWMPIVLETYRQLPDPKHLIMVANDNHRQVSVEKVPRRYFASLLGEAAAFPVVATPEVRTDGSNLILSTTATGGDSLTVTFVVKRMALAEFRWKEGPVWEELPAKREGETWVATIPALAEGEQLIAYANVDDGEGGLGSSDTVEVPVYPKWRGK